MGHGLLFDIRAIYSLLYSRRLLTEEALKLRLSASSLSRNGVVESCKAILRLSYAHSILIIRTNDLWLYSLYIYRLIVEKVCGEADLVRVVDVEWTGYSSAGALV